MKRLSALVACGLIAYPQLAFSREILGVVGLTHVYSSQPIALNSRLTGTLTENDIPTGDGSYAYDCSIGLLQGTRIVIEASSEHFDTVLLLINQKGKVVARNDDMADGSSNSALLYSVKESGQYYIRIHGMALTSGGGFELSLMKAE